MRFSRDCTEISLFGSSKVYRSQPDVLGRSARSPTRTFSDVAPGKGLSFPDIINLAVFITVTMVTTVIAVGNIGTTIIFLITFVSKCLIVGFVTSQCISVMDLLKLIYMLPHWVQIQLSTSSGHGILTLGQPVRVLTLKRQAPGIVATGVPIFKSLVRLNPEKIPTAQARIKPQTSHSQGRHLNL